MKSRTSQAVVAIASAALAISGCGLIGDAGNESKRETNVNMQEAGDRAEQILDGTLAGIKPAVEARRGPSSDPICTDFKGDGTGTGSVTRRRYVMTIISDERRGSFLGVVERQWKKKGYEITTVREHKEMPAIFASTPEGFRISLEFGYKGQAFLDATSPCVAESRVTEAPREPLDPNSEASKRLPYIRSDFWSADKPL
ncbi:hypothetical protein N4P33_23615 [Streptomyces sp. 15-116A]|uniref:hypothetical protein n=1 Tax=Streptomyces sp. 15-116A TaxID=2259035 RepID=UPI0021B3743A|nr:hypothetical protein [Streptomyces sp. 15-116A]MCT7355117.1 hypothetical protein [Streptomyces sp. 15-116A]